MDAHIPAESQVLLDTTARDEPQLVEHLSLAFHFSIYLSNLNWSRLFAFYTFGSNSSSLETCRYLAKQHRSELLCIGRTMPFARLNFLTESQSPPAELQTGSVSRAHSAGVYSPPTAGLVHSAWLSIAGATGTQEASNIDDDHHLNTALGLRPQFE